MKSLETLANELDNLQKPENKGRGISFIESIINSLKHGNLEEAKRIYSWDADKLDSHPKVSKWLLDNFGCRLHHIINCKDQLCSDIQNSIERK